MYGWLFWVCRGNGSPVGVARGFGGLLVVGRGRGGVVVRSRRGLFMVVGGYFWWFLVNSSVLDMVMWLRVVGFSLVMIWRRRAGFRMMVRFWGKVRHQVLMRIRGLRYRAGAVYGGAEGGGVGEGLGGGWPGVGTIHHRLRAVLWHMNMGLGMRCWLMVGPV